MDPARGGLWILRYPPRHHTSTDSDSWCEADHGPAEGWQKPNDEERVQRLDENRLIVDVRHERLDWGIRPGTRLRLDAVRARTISYAWDVPTPWGFLGGDYEETQRRYCVLDGPMAGTCWESTEARAVTVPHQEPL